MKKKLYIAYGSNINLEQMAVRCPTADVVCKGMIKDYELQFRRVATIEPKENSKVPVMIWSLGEKDERSLDRYEGYPNFYRKETFKVELDGESYDAMAYIMNNGEIAPPLPSYYNAILQGYLENGMDTEYLDQALENAEISQGSRLDDEQQMSL